MRQITVLSKPGCHLCEIVVEALHSLSHKYEFEVIEQDILQNEKLHNEYWVRIPVVLVEGRVVFEARDMGRPTECAAQLERVIFP